MKALDDAAEFHEVALPWRGLPPGEADLAVRLRRRKRQDLDVAPARFGFEADARKKRDAQSIRDHLNNGGKACRSEGIEVFNLLEVAKAQRLIAQAMTFFKEKQAVVFEEIGGCGSLRRQPPRRWQRQHERVLEKDLRLDLGMLDRQSQEQRIQAARDETFDQILGLGFAQMQIEGRMLGSERRQELRQNIRRDGGYDAELQPAGENACAVAGVVGKVADAGEDRGDAARNLLTLGS
jgi:hypothetical protein